MKEKSYSGEQLKKALIEIEKRESVRKAAHLYNLAKATLQSRINQNELQATKKGSFTIFSTEQEEIISLWIKTMAKAGFPLTKEGLLAIFLLFFFCFRVFIYSFKHKEVHYLSILYFTILKINFYLQKIKYLGVPLLGGPLLVHLKFWWPTTGA